MKEFHLSLFLLWRGLARVAGRAARVHLATGLGRLARREIAIGAALGERARLSLGEAARAKGKANG